MTHQNLKVREMTREMALTVACCSNTPECGYCSQYIPYFQKIAFKLNCTFTAFIPVCWPCLGLLKLIGFFCVDICQLLSTSRTSFRVLCDKTQSREAVKVGKQTSNKERLKWKKNMKEMEKVVCLPPQLADLLRTTIGSTLEVIRSSSLRACQVSRVISS